jgi:hypothetical protein
MSANIVFEIGDVVRIIRIPPAVLDDSPAETRSIFKRALGQTFVVRGFGPYGHVELDVSKIEWGNTIWVEPDCLQLFRRRAKRHHRG